MTSTITIENNEPKKMPLWLKIFIGMIAGIILGTIFQAMLPEDGDLLIPLGLFDFAVRGFFVDGLFEVTLFYL